eukprot:TRINITY_DN6021_c0_g1_i2.p1 TRINITY_DN6021_c0_g1~~TRINITY_DN6021_c0_g1_i2.p1  ORF type:complete len:413 (+),score=66.22 TRINITY_DN6021_c0_g1_i2:418-1656(+)
MLFVMSSEETIEYPSPSMKHAGSPMVRRYNKRRRKSSGGDAQSFVCSDDGCENLLSPMSLRASSHEQDVKVSSMDVVSSENVYFELGEQMKFLSSERTALKLDSKRPLDSFEYFSASTSVSSEMRRGDDHLQNKNYSNAIDSYERAASMEDDNKHVFFRLGKAHLDASQPEKAIPFFKKALQLDQVDKQSSLSSAASLFLYLGASYLLLHRYSDATKCYQHALLRNPFCVYSRIGLGRALKSQNQLDFAIHHFKLAVHIEPTNINALECLSMAEYEQNDFVSSLKHLQMLLAISPSHSEAKRLVDWIQSTRSSQMDVLSNLSPSARHLQRGGGGVFSVSSSSSTVDVEDMSRSHHHNRIRHNSLSGGGGSSGGTPGWLSGTNTESAYSALMDSWNDCIRTLGSTTGSNSNKS